MLTKSIETPDWSTIPPPEDDGGARHLRGRAVASIKLSATNGSDVDLSVLRGLVVVYAYPRTGRPNEPNPDGWDLIPEADGMYSAQSCAFRDHYAELRSLGMAHLFGLLTQDTAWQREAAERLHLPYSILSDESLRLTMAMRFPTFETSGMICLKRMTLVILDGVIEHVFYPVFPPDQNASEVTAWLRNRNRSHLSGSN